ncbi:cellulose binding domain-containing protein [Streptomyces sp. IBSNAI002]|uniref:cellulose binding domain-containing protein n=1 Tax=Streptomyces sp. IBSNAI002 TaxID=3457500 RepID=UPI003FD1719B
MLSQARGRRRVSLRAHPVEVQAAATGAMAVSFAKTAQWSTGYTGCYELRNASPHMQKDWRLEFVLPEGVEIHSMWNATYAVTGRTVTVTPEHWIRDIEPGRRISIGFGVRHEAAAHTAQILPHPSAASRIRRMHPSTSR